MLGYEEDPPRCSGSSWIPSGRREQVKRRIGFLPKDWDSTSTLNFPSTRTSTFAKLRLVPEAELRERKARLLASPAWIAFAPG